jgi:hypothetical protein
MNTGGFSWKRLLGITAFKNDISRAIVGFSRWGFA